MSEQVAIQTTTVPYGSPPPNADEGWVRSPVLTNDIVVIEGFLRGAPVFLRCSDGNRMSIVSRIDQATQFQLRPYSTAINEPLRVRDPFWLATVETGRTTCSPGSLLSIDQQTPGKFYFTPPNENRGRTVQVSAVPLFKSSDTKIIQYGEQVFLTIPAFENGDVLGDTPGRVLCQQNGKCELTTEPVNLSLAINDLSGNSEQVENQPDISQVQTFSFRSGSLRGGTVYFRAAPENSANANKPNQNVTQAQSNPNVNVNTSTNVQITPALVDKSPNSDHIAQEIELIINQGSEDSEEIKKLLGMQTQALSTFGIVATVLFAVIFLALIAAFVFFFYKRYQAELQRNSSATISGTFKNLFERSRGEQHVANPSTKSRNSPKKPSLFSSNKSSFLKPLQSMRSERSPSPVSTPEKSENSPFDLGPTMDAPVQQSDFDPGPEPSFSPVLLSPQIPVLPQENQPSVPLSPQIPVLSKENQPSGRMSQISKRTPFPEGELRPAGSNSPLPRPTNGSSSAGPGWVSATMGVPAT